MLAPGVPCSPLREAGTLRFQGEAQRIRQEGHPVVDPHRVDELEDLVVVELAAKGLPGVLSSSARGCQSR